jgi:hypothetical protein
MAGRQRDGMALTVRASTSRVKVELPAEVRSMIVWFDLVARKVRVPPPELAAAIAALPRRQDYAVL